MSWSNRKGFNFRETAGYVTDGANETNDLGLAYPQSRTVDGDTFNIGWDVNMSGTGLGRMRDRNASNPAHTAGLAQWANSSASVHTWRLDLGSAGQKSIRLAAGDASFGQRVFLRVLDNATPVITISNVAVGGNQFADAAGNVRTSAADWETNNTAVTVTFASTTCYVEIGDVTGLGADNSPLAHFSIVDVAAPHALAGDAQSSVSATGAITTAIPVTGAAAVVATATGAMSTGIRLTGAVSSVTTANGNLSTQIRLSVAAVVNALASGGLTTATLLAGAAAAQAAMSATLTSIITAGPSVSISGTTATITWTTPTAMPSRVEWGDAPAYEWLKEDETAVTSHTLVLDAPDGIIEGKIYAFRILDAAGSIIYYGTFAVPYILAGAVTVQATVTGTLGNSGLAGSAQVVAAMAGAITTSIRMQAAAQVTATATGALSTGVAMQGAATAQAIMSAPLTTSVRLNGAAVSQALATGALTSGIPLQGHAAAQASASAALITAIPLVGAAQVSVNVSGDFNGSAAQLSGAAASVVSGDGGLTTSITMTGAALMQALAQAAMQSRINLAGAAGVNAIMQADLRIEVGLNGTAIAQTAASGALVDAVPPVIDPRWMVDRSRRDWRVERLAA